MEPPATETNGVIEANASLVEISSQWMANGASGDNMGNVREPAAVVSREGSANAITHLRRTTVVTASVIESNIAAVAPRNVHREVLISGSYCFELLVFKSVLKRLFMNTLYNVEMYMIMNLDILLKL